jgi:hypothetical protein
MRLGYQRSMQLVHLLLLNPSRVLWPQELSAKLSPFAWKLKQHFYAPPPAYHYYAHPLP